MKNVLNFLNANRLLYIPVIEALERGEGKVIAFDEDGAVVEMGGWVVSLCLTSDEALLKHADLVKKRLCVIYGARDLTKIAQYFPLARQVPCWQMVYTKKEPPVFKTDAEFKLLDRTWAQFVFDTYCRPTKNLEHITHLLDKNYIYGIFVCGEIAGFCGRHDEGSMGLLEILPKFRRQGLGRIMEQFIIREVLNEGRTPYGHIVFGNDASMSLQRSIEGVVFLPETVMWHSCKPIKT
ncbi:MAG: GNAT family N-acetyltransferase [Firmicutes bacterium]|nr:GNAT family N-acetyltransferase [Bacillota bacterium]